MRNPSSSSSPSSAKTAANTSSSSSKTPCCSKVGLKRGPWTPEEDVLLANYINKEGEGRWRTLPKRAGLLRCGKSCRLRWMNYLRPSVKRGQIAPDEEDLILRLHRLLGNRWSLIAGRIPGRTDNEIKNYWNTHLSKKLISQGIDPRTHKPLNPTDQQTSGDPKASSSSKAYRQGNSATTNPNKATNKNSQTPPDPSSSEAETTRGTPLITTNEENGYSQSHNASLDDCQTLGGGHGFTSLLNCEDSAGMEMRSNGNHNQVQVHSNEEADEDINYCTDDVFSSFLNSLINEEAFSTHHLQQQQANGMAPGSDPIVSSITASSFGLGTSWESPLMSSSFNPTDHHPKRVTDHVE